MKQEDILILAKAGFTAAQISALAQMRAPAPAKDQEPTPAPAKDQEPTPAPAKDPEPTPAPAGITQEQLHKEMQQLAILFSGSQRVEPEQTTDDILAALIAPDKK